MTRFGIAALLAGLALLFGAFALWRVTPGGDQPVARADRPGEPPRRIVSVNVCSDQYLLALADRNQIAGLTNIADQPEWSAAAHLTDDLPLLAPSAEEILAIAPDLVIGMPASGSAMIAAMPGGTYRTLDLASATTFPGIAGQIRLVAREVGRPERGERLVAEMERRLEELPRNGGGRVAAYYQRRGFLTGAGTLVDDLIRRAGLVNLAARLGRPALSRLSIEELVAAQPDFIIVESATGGSFDQGTEMLDHPALRHIPRLVLPQAWTVCDGPAYVRAARSLAAQIAAHGAKG